MAGRLIAIGDIHGCHAEFAELLGRLSPTRDDRIVLLGDLVNRGPDSRRVIELARAVGALALLGNHELRLLEWRRTRKRSVLKEGDAETLKQLREEDLQYLETMPLHHEDPATGVVFVHAGFLPGDPWWVQPAEVVTRIQVVDPAGGPARREERPGDPLWCDLWKGPPFVVYGHTPEPEVRRRRWSLGIDTGCVKGGSLTACVLPSRRLVQVKAHRVY